MNQRIFLVGKQDNDVSDSEFADDERSDNDNEEDSDTLSEVISEAADSYGLDTPPFWDSREEYGNISIDEGSGEVIIYVNEVEGFAKSALFAPMGIILPLPRTATEPGGLYTTKDIIGLHEDMEKCEKLVFDAIEGCIELGALRQEFHVTENFQVGLLDDIDYEGDSEDSEGDDFAEWGGGMDVG